MPKIKISQSSQLTRGIQKEVRRKLKALKKNGVHLSQTQIADHLGVSQSNVSRILHSKNISLEIVIDFALALDVEFDIGVYSTIGTDKIKEIQSDKIIDHDNSNV